jgi:hypothetical protein
VERRQCRGRVPSPVVQEPEPPFPHRLVKVTMVRKSEALPQVPVNVQHASACPGRASVRTTSNGLDRSRPAWPTFWPAEARRTPRSASPLTALRCALSRAVRDPVRALRTLRVTSLRPTTRSRPHPPLSRGCSGAIGLDVDELEEQPKTHVWVPGMIVERERWLRVAPTLLTRVSRQAQRYWLCGLAPVVTVPGWT